MINIAICDDDIELTGTLETMISNIAVLERFTCEINVFWDGKGLVESICDKNNRYDIVFLDIEMKELNGLEAARIFRRVDEIALLIYITNHKKYAIKAYDAQPFQFLIKPVEFSTLHKYLKKAKDRVASGNFYFTYRNSSAIRRGKHLYTG